MKVAVSVKQVIIRTGVTNDLCQLVVGFVSGGITHFSYSILLTHVSHFILFFAYEFLTQKECLWDSSEKENKCNSAPLLKITYNLTCQFFQSYYNLNLTYLWILYFCYSLHVPYTPAKPDDFLFLEVHLRASEPLCTLFHLLRNH